jgi:hypothetical protein
MDGAQIQAISSPTVNPVKSRADPHSSYERWRVCSPHVATNGRGPGNNPYPALVLCPGDVTLKSGRTIAYDPPMDAKRYIENSI